MHVPQMTFYKPTTFYQVFFSWLDFVLSQQKPHSNSTVIRFLHQYSFWDIATVTTQYRKPALGYSWVWHTCILLSDLVNTFDSMSALPFPAYLSAGPPFSISAITKMLCLPTKVSAMVNPNPWLSAVKLTSTYSCLHNRAFAQGFRLPDDQNPLFLFDICLRPRRDESEFTLENDDLLLPTPLWPYHGECLPAVLAPMLLERAFRTLEYIPEIASEMHYYFYCRTDLSVLGYSL